LSERIDPEFNIDRVVFSVEEFLSLLNSGVLKAGSAIVFDEAGVGVPSREWYSLSNKIINRVFQTFRRDNLAVIFTAPDFKFIDSQTQRLFHCYMEMTKRPNKSKKCGYLKWLDMSNDPRQGKTYYLYPRFTNHKGEICAIKEIEVSLPSQELRDGYDEKQKVWKEQLKKDSQMTIEAERTLKNLKLDEEEIAKAIMKNKKEFLTVDGRSSMKVFSVAKIEMKYKLPVAMARRLKRYLDEVQREKVYAK